MESDTWFRLHFTLASKSMSDQVLALHALFAMLERAAYMSEESLALAQLAWWQAELSAEVAQTSAHPVVRALRMSGALSGLPQPLLDVLVGQAFEIAQRPRPNTIEELKALSDRVGAPRVLAELALARGGRVPEQALGHCAGTGLSCMLSISLRSGAGLWFIPLSLQARLQSDAKAIEGPTPEGRAAMGTLMELGQEWFGEQMQTLAAVISKQQVSSAMLQHPFAWMATQQLQLLRTLENLKGSRRDPGRWRVNDFIKVWRQCRRLSKASGAA